MAGARKSFVHQQMWEQPDEDPNRLLMIRCRDQIASPREANMDLALVAAHRRDCVMPRSLTRSVAKPLLADRSRRQMASLQRIPMRLDVMRRQWTNNLRTAKHVSCVCGGR